MSKAHQFRVLHLSDLHISCQEGFDQAVVFDPLLQRIERDQKAGFRPQMIVVTGDIASQGIKKEYDLAKEFFDALLKSLNLSAEQIFIVPGNHDVNRKKYRPKDVPVYENMQELNKELEDTEYRGDLLKGMEEYFQFIEEHYPHHKCIDQGLVPFVKTFSTGTSTATTKNKKIIRLIGLNSAWMCRKSDDERMISIGEYQIKKAMESFKEEKEKAFDLQIFLLHHPLSWLWPKDKTICRHHFNNSLLLCGHLHQPGGGFFDDLEGSLYQFQAGGAYLGSNSDWPCRFHYITFDWQNNLITLDFRKFNPEKRKWILDTDTGDEGRKSFPMDRITTVDPEEKKKEQEMSREKLRQRAIFEPYLTTALEEHRHLPTQGFETNVRISIELERIYINMRAVIQLCDFEYTKVGKNLMKERIREHKLSALDIRATFAATHKFNIKDMVILGDPGAGKTTLLKYILIMLIQGRGEEKIGIDTHLIPFFAPLRELKNPDKEKFVDFLQRVCRLEKFSIKEKELLALLDEGGSIILLDGLDEVADETARRETCKWIDEARMRFAKTRFVITSRFAGYLGKSRLEGNCLELSIQDFTEDEIKAFLMRWFESVEAIVHGGKDDAFWKEKGRDQALTLFNHIVASKHIKKLAVTPLLLQIIALVHRDRGALPQRRVELYKECTNVLLEKWNLAKGLDVLISADEARKMLQPLALWLHDQDERRSAPMEQILKVIEAPLQEIGKSGLDAKKLLLNIRDRSGIFVGYSESEYGFTHLSFQEYLAAEEVRNQGKIDLLIEKYGQKWWKEVTRLCLALNNPSVISEFMHLIIPTESFKTDISLVLDAIGDSIVNPVTPFADALNNKDLSLEARLNSLRVVKKMTGPKAIQALKTAVKNKDNPLSIIRAAYKALESMGETEGVEKPADDLTPTTFTSSVDQAEMVLVPAGPFLYGSHEDDKEAASNEKPQRVIDLPQFYIDKYPVTNEQYGNFLNKAAPAENTLNKWIDLKGSFRKERCRIKLEKKRFLVVQKERFLVEKGYERHPVIYVSWRGAEAYAKWSGKYLPTEQQWEKAARGPDGFIYPWGNEFDKTLCNTEGSKSVGTTPVEKFPAGKSPYGCFDMAGNVWEWTDSLYDKMRNGGFFAAGRGSAEHFSAGARVASSSSRTAGATV